MVRIRELRKNHGLTMKEVGGVFNVGESTISMWENGHREPDLATIKRLADYFGVTTDYLLGKSNQQTAVPPKAIRVPVLGRIAAGIPIEAIEEVLDYEEIPIEMGKGGAEYFALQLRGDSMSPEYRDGDVVIFQKADDCENGDECAVIINGNDATFKKIIKQMNGILLQPLNTLKYKPEFYTNSEIENLPINVIGVARELRRKKN